MRKTLVPVFSSLIFLFSCKGGISQSFDCPRLEELQRTIDGIQKGLTLVKVERSPVAGLCEVVVKISETEKGLFYTDSKGQYIVTGNIIEISTRKNLTSEKLAHLNRRVLDKATMSELEKVVAFSWGTSGPSIYFITDPDCPFCKQAEAILENLVKGGKLTVKVILFPLEAIHPEARAKSVSIICDNRGYEGLKTGYKSRNQCEQGIRKVDETIRLMQKIGVRGTPTYVFPDGEIRSGVMQAEAILAKLDQKSQ